MFIKSRRGGALVSVLFLGIFAGSLMMAVTAATVYPQWELRRRENRVFARDLAYSLLDEMRYKVRHDAQYGTTPATLENSLNIESYRNLQTNSEATLRFGKANALLADESLNNGGNDSGVVTPDGVKVPAHGLYLVAKARFGADSVTIRQLLSVPQFPYVVATSGPFRTSGGFLLARIPAGVDFKGPIPDKDYLPGHLLTNGQDDGSGAALQLGPGTQIVGDAKAVGSAAYEQNEVDLTQGQIFQNVKPEVLSPLNIQDYNPAGRIEPVVLGSDHYTESKSVAGYASHQGSVVFDHGLKLNGGLLWVEGDVTITGGGISGNGALVCTGHVIVKGGSDLAAPQTTAILAGGDVRLEGDDRTGSTYQGLIYAGGQGGIPGQDPDLDLQVSRVTVSGCLLAAGKGADGQGGKTEVRDARLLYDPRAVKLDLSMNLSAAGTSYGRGYVGPQLAAGRESIGSFWDANSGSYRAPDPANPAAWDGILQYTVQLADGSTRTFTTWAEATANASPASRRALLFETLAMRNSIAQEISQTQAALANSHQTATVNLDLNKFLQTKDKMRLVWESES